MTPFSRAFAALITCAFGLLALAGCSADSQPSTLAPHVDPSRYAGRWYVIANIPYFAENGNVGSTFDIAFQPGDKLTDIYTAHPKDFSAPVKAYTMNGYVVPDTGNARWRESPFWPLYLSYLILYVDPRVPNRTGGLPRPRVWLGLRPPAGHRRRHLPIPSWAPEGRGLRYR